MKKKILSLAKILFGVALTDIAMGMIVLPQNFAVGGVTGLSVLLSKSIPLSVSMIVLFCQCHFVYPGIYIRWSKIHPENIAGQHCFPHRTRYLPTHQFFAPLEERSAGQRNYRRIAGRNRERSRLERRQFKRRL